MDVSVVVTGYHQEEIIVSCLKAILRNERCEEILLADEGTDGTAEKVKALNEPRIRILPIPRGLGPAAARNAGMREARGKFVFFTDADCIVSPNWIEEGLAAFHNPDVVGVEGNIYYATVPDSIRYKVPVNPFYHSFDRLINRPGSDFAAGNIAFRKDVLLKLKGFNTQDFGFAREDSDLGWRALAFGKIEHQPNMRVDHGLEYWSWKGIVRSARRYEKDTLFFKNHGKFFFQFGRILHPKLLFFPTLLWKYRGMSFKDVTFLPAFIAYTLLARLYIWKGALKYRVFAI